MLSAVVQIPSGTVTFLLTDVEGSTETWEADPATAAAPLRTHEEIVADAVAVHGGFRPVEQGEGDSLVAAFDRASDAVAAALTAQLGLSREKWPTAQPVRIRIALHTGEADVHGGRYAGRRSSGRRGSERWPTAARRSCNGRPPRWPGRTCPRLRQVRLLTLTGAGGCGKTRLAAHAAAMAAESYPAGVWWADLAPLRSGSAVSTAVLSAIGLREHPARTAVEQLAAHLGNGRAILVADNCEHVLDPVVALVEPLLTRAPELTVLATSREALGVAGETTWRVPPLTMPAPACAPTPEALGAYDAVALFVARARQARPNFAVTNEAAPAVAEICARLDGIPLAIELAAARVRVLSPDQIRSGLDDRFRLLTAPPGRSMGRHHTLSASVEWSYDLLDEAERVLLHRLSVFAGGFTLDAAEHVCAGAGIEALQILDGRPDPALTMASDVVEWARSVEDQRYLARAMTIEGVVRTMADPVDGEPVLQAAVIAGDAASDPISSVLVRLVLLVCAIHQDDHHLVARYLDEGRLVFEAASGQMQAMWHALAGWSDVRCGRLDAARARAASASQLAERFGDPLFAGALVALLRALIELAGGRSEEAATVLEPLLREPRAAGPTREDAMLTGAWGCVLAARNRLEEVEAVVAESVRLADEIGEGLQVAFCRAWYAGLLRWCGHTDRARDLAESLLEHARQQHNASFEAAALRELSALARLDGHLETADDLAHRALAVSASTGLLPDIAADLIHVAGIAVAEEGWEEAVRLFGAAEAVRHRLGIALPSWDEPVVEADLAVLRSALDDDSFAAAWAEGQGLAPEEAVAYAERARGQRKRPTTGWAGLTPMERQVVDLLSGGLRNAEIAERQ